MKTIDLEKDLKKHFLKSRGESWELTYLLGMGVIDIFLRDDF